MKLLPIKPKDLYLSTDIEKNPSGFDSYVKEQSIHYDLFGNDKILIEFFKGSSAVWVCIIKEE
jgi:hypothetical protein